MKKYKKVLLFVFLSLVSVGYVSAVEESTRLFVAVQISDNIIKPFAEYSSGTWNAITLDSDAIDLGFETFSDNPWKIKPKIALLANIQINGVQGDQLLYWYERENKKPTLVSQFSQFGGNIESERTGWGLTVASKENLSVSGDWHDYSNKILLSRPINTSLFKKVAPSLLNEKVYRDISIAMLEKEKKEVVSNLKRCGKGFTSELKNYAPDYCDYWRAYSKVIQQAEVKVEIKEASLLGLNVYFIKGVKVMPAPREICPRETLFQGWFKQEDGEALLIGKKIILTDCDGKEIGSQVVPLSLFEVDGNRFVVSEDFGYEGSNYVIRKYDKGKLKVVFDSSGYAENW